MRRAAPGAGAIIIASSEGGLFEYTHRHELHPCPGRRGVQREQERSVARAMMSGRIHETTNKVGASAGTVAQLFGVAGQDNGPLEAAYGTAQTRACTRASPDERRSRNPRRYLGVNARLRRASP
jgi:hypothetical protein